MGSSRQQLHGRVEEVLISLPVGLAWADVDGTIRFVNRKFTSMFGYTVADLTTVHAWIESCYAVPEQAVAIDEFWRSQAGTGDEAPAEIEEFELDILCKDGTVKTVLSGKIRLPDQAGALSTFLDITPRKHEEEIVRQQALEDPLTGLLNKRAFREMLEGGLSRSVRNRTTLALLLVDLDRFKHVNDEWGHDQGDFLLRQLARRLRYAVRHHDPVFRIGGDEFCVLMDDVDRAFAENAAARILEETARPFRLQGTVVSTSVSIGIASCPGDARDAERLFRLADEALYRAKTGGRDRWCR